MYIYYIYIVLTLLHLAFTLLTVYSSMLLIDIALFLKNIICIFRVYLLLNSFKTGRKMRINYKQTKILNNNKYS